MRHSIARAWRTPTLLIGLSLVPFAASANRVVWILSDTRSPEANLIRYDGAFGSLTVHILPGTVFLMLAALQFSPALRARHRSWHRVGGKAAILAGIAAGLSGVWLVVAYPPGPLTTPTFDTVRAAAGAALVAALLLALHAIRRRDVPSHRVWMIRAFALGVAGTPQALLIGLWTAVVAPLTPRSATALISLGFLLNTTLTEARIRAPRRAPSPIA